MSQLARQGKDCFDVALGGEALGLVTLLSPVTRPFGWSSESGADANGSTPTGRLREADVLLGDARGVLEADFHLS